MLLEQSMIVARKKNSMLILQQTAEYVTQAPYFWQTMSWIIACAMFLGATIYNGDVSKLTKWLVTTVPYTILIITTNLMRLHAIDIGNHIQAYAGTVTIIFVSFFYFLGMTIGVGLLHCFVRKE